MNYTHLLFENNSNIQRDNIIKHKLHLCKSELVYDINVNTFTGDQIYEILLVINYVKRTYNGARIPLIINAGNITFYDKLVYVILENICWYMITVEKRRFKVLFCAKHTIWSEGISYSPLIYLNDISKFTKKYVSDLYNRHFRKVIPCIKKGNEQYLSDLMQEIRCFLENNGINEDSSGDLSEVLSELVGNAGEHGKTECLIDIDITEDRYTKGIEQENYYGMNAVIMNYSQTLFFEPLMKKMNNQTDFNERYKFIIEAKENHEQQFNEKYTEEDFFTVSSFQHKISGSERKNEIGGTGLTQLIHSLEEKAENHLCYMLSGNRLFFFQQEYMKYDTNNFIGFNESGDYIREKPSDNIFQTIRTYFPGTAYNLNFAIKKEWSL